MTRPTLDVTLGPLCTAAKQSGAVVRIEMESAKRWTASVCRFPGAKPSVVVTGKTAAAAAELLKKELERNRKESPREMAARILREKGLAAA